MILKTVYPQYIERGGEQAIRQPYEFKNASVHNFLVAAERECLQALCDRFLNTVAGDNIYYQVAASYVLLAFLENEQVYSLDPKSRSTGWISEIDVAFWIPVISYQKVSGIPIPRRLVWFMPYLFVDNVSAMIAGREIYGFHKMMGEFILPKLDSVADIFALDTVGVECFSADSRWIRQRLFEVRRLERTATNPYQQDWTNINSASHFVNQLFAQMQSDLVGKTYDFISNFITFSSLETIPVVFLKQFRDVQYPERACYQAIVEAQAKLTQFHKGGLLQGTYELNIRHLDSHPICQELGLKVGTQEIKSAFWFNYDFIMETGKEI